MHGLRMQLTLVINYCQYCGFFKLFHSSCERQMTFELAQLGEQSLSDATLQRFGTALMNMYGLLAFMIINLFGLQL